MNTTPPDRSVEEIVRNWLEEEKKDNYVDIYDLNQVTLDGYFSLSNLIESLTSLHTQGFEAGRRETEKAFGGCTKCYGKGYATVKENYTHHADFIGDKTYTTPAPIMRFCSCERGNALSDAQKRITDNT